MSKAEVLSTRKRQVEFRVEGMDCPSCLAGIRHRLERLDGVLAAEGSTVARTVSVEYDEQRIDPDFIRHEIGELGYAPFPAATVLPEPARVWRGARAAITYTAASLFSAGLLLRLALGAAHSGAAPGFLLRPDVPGWLFLAAAGVGAWSFLPKAVRAARGLLLDMHVLMSVAIFGALVIGEYLEAGAIAVLFSLAELLEAHAVERAHRSVRALMELSPETARVLRDGRETVLPASEVQVGEEVVVRLGESIPVDGEVVAGHSAVNEAPITGESSPVEKAPGSEVFAGTIAEEGFLRVRSTRGRSDTTLARMIRLVEAAERRRAPSERFVERFARVYTPVVTLFALLLATIPVFVFGEPVAEWLVRGLTLLVIACPCALVISTPVCVVSGVTSAARNGVLITGGLSLEVMGGVRVVAFDKTGTLTHGRASLTSIVPLDGTSAGEVLALAAAAEVPSEHPVAKAIVRAARDAGLTIETGSGDAFEVLPGRGVRAHLGGKEITVGSLSLIDSGEVPEPAVRLTEVGSTAVLVLRSGTPIGVLGLSDPARPAAAEVISELRAAGVERVVLLTGDVRSVARAVAREVGTDDTLAGLGPKGKVEVIRELERTHGRVAMVGDGVNDAPALAAASVGIAMGAAGSDAALETADIALLGDDLSRLPYLVRLSQKARRVIRQNILAAILIKAVLALGIPFGAVSLITAVLVGDMGASLGVTLNAMRLARLRA